MPDFVDPEIVEQMLDSCLQTLEQHEFFFTSWEKQFLESVEDQIDGNVITEKQFDKLEQIYRRTK